MKYFKDNEFTNISKLNLELLTKLDKYRELLGYPVTITSDYELSGHSKNSEHYEGMAVDCKSKASLDLQYKTAVKVGFENIGLYPAWNGLHLGIRGKEGRRWIGLGSDANQEYIKFNKENYDKYILKIVK